jgi:hypothetical protein
MSNIVDIPGVGPIAIGGLCLALVESGNSSKYTGGRRWKRATLIRPCGGGFYYDVKLLDGTVETVSMYNIDRIHQRKPTTPTTETEKKR